MCASSADTVCYLSTCEFTLFALCFVLKPYFKGLVAVKVQCFILDTVQLLLYDLS